MEKEKRIRKSSFYLFTMLVLISIIIVNLAVGVIQTNAVPNDNTECSRITLGFDTLELAITDWDDNPLTAKEIILQADSDTAKYIDSEPMHLKVKNLTEHPITIQTNVLMTGDDANLLDSNSGVIVKSEEFYQGTTVGNSTPVKEGIVFKSSRIDPGEFIKVKVYIRVPNKAELSNLDTKILLDIKTTFVDASKL